MSIRNPLPLAQRRLFFVAVLVIVMALILVHRLFIVQLKEGDKYTESLRNQTTVSMVLPPARGSIMDRNGVPLAENKASYDIDVYLREIVGYYSRLHKGKLPKTEVQIGRGKLRRGKQVVDVQKIVNDMSGAIVKALKIRSSFSRGELLRHYDQKPNIPIQLASDLDFKLLSQFSEKSMNVTGIQETARPVRNYNYGALASHILGYVGQLEEATEDDYQPEFVGKQGVEKSFDEYLQGVPGGKILRKNNLGYILSEEATRQPEAGKFVYLSLDARIQWITEQVMRKVGRGAAIVLDPNNGDILAMVSVPNFDPNQFVPKIDHSTWVRLTQDPTRPMFNRAISAYAAGSIYKPIVALAALENKKLNPPFTPQTIINSPGAVWLANRWWKDWSPNGQGDIALRTGLAMSCNTFFYQLGLRTGIQSLVDMGKRVGLGERLLDLDGQQIIYGESAGVLPGPEWMEDIMKKKLDKWREAKKTNPKLPRPGIERWSDGHTINTSIGQGYVAVTPLQMAVLMASIANGGKVYYPRLVMGVAKMKGGELVPLKEYGVRVRGDLGMDDKNLQAVRDGLLAVVEEGTGRRAAVPGRKVAGKTGTAQFETTIMGRRVKDLRTWFNGFAPYDQPKYVVTVIVEGGTSGGSTVAPLVGEILQKIFEMEDRGGQIDMAYLAPAIGHFAGVKETASDTAPALPPSEVESDNSSSGRPSIRGVRGLR